MSAPEAPTPLQRLSEIMEAGDNLGPPGSEMTAQQIRAYTSFCASARLIARFLASPEAAEVLARAICRADLDDKQQGVGNHIEEGRQSIVDADWSYFEAEATACLNTIAEQALRGPSNG